MPAAAPAQPDEPAVLEGAVRHRLVLDEAFVKSIPADVTFETDKVVGALYGASHHAASGRERDRTCRRPRWRGFRRVPLAAARAARG
jgi:hypothetical protein